MARKDRQLKSVEFKSVDYIVVGSFMEMFKTRSKEVVLYLLLLQLTTSFDLVLNISINDPTTI